MNLKDLEAIDTELSDLTDEADAMDVRRRAIYNRRTELDAQRTALLGGLLDGLLAAKAAAPEAATFAELGAVMDSQAKG